MNQPSIFTRQAMYKSLFITLISLLGQRAISQATDSKPLANNQSPSLEAKFLQNTFPFNAQPGDSFEVTKEWAKITSGGTLYLPKDFRIVVAKEVDEIDWYFNKIIFDDNTTIDLSRRIPNTQKTKQPDGASPVHYESCNYYVNIQDGQPGGTGLSGESGLHGTNFTLTVHKLSDHGNLWIRTDGADGGDGQDGGNGGHGAAGNADHDHYHNAGQGGNGGPGGLGGDAGGVSRVLLTIDGTPIHKPSSCYESTQPHSAPSTRPVSVIGTDIGNIEISGINGVPGVGGMSGVKGEGGSACGTKGNANGTPLVHTQNGSGKRPTCPVVIQ